MKLIRNWLKVSISKNIKIVKLTAALYTSGEEARRLFVEYIGRSVYEK